MFEIIRTSLKSTVGDIAEYGNIPVLNPGTADLYMSPERRSILFSRVFLTTESTEVA